MVGTAARMRASLLTSPFWIGTFRSSRMRTRFPESARPAIFSIFMIHTTFDQATVVSSIRLENPHSLSYQAQAFTSVPWMTLVRVAS